MEPQSKTHFILTLNFFTLQDIIVETVGMYAHVVNIMVLILIPMVIIHINGHAFSLSKCFHLGSFILIVRCCRVILISIFSSNSGRYVRLFPLFDSFYETVELRSGEHVVSQRPEGHWLA